MHLSMIREGLPGAKFINDYLAYGNPNTKNALYKSLRLPELLGSDYKLSGDGPLIDRIKRRVALARRTLAVHGIALPVQLAATLIWCQIHPPLAAVHGLLAVKDLLAIINQASLNRRLSSVAGRQGVKNTVVKALDEVNSLDD